MKHKPIFVTGIGTGIGKTISSAVIVESLKADYWKPVQSGDLDHSDTDRVRNLVSNDLSVFHPETYRLTQPFSPHKSAALDKITIDLNAITLPFTERQLVIEGAGGLMVPLNHDDLIIDFIEKLDAEVMLVSQNYLGSINHTLLSLEMLKARNITLRNIIISGQRDKDSEEVIKNYSGRELRYIPQFETLDRETIGRFSKSFEC